jgi:hypothetical protein
VVFASVGWPDVTIALIAGLPGILAAFAALRVNQQIRTPSKTSIGRQIEDVNHTARANNYHLQAMGGDLGTKQPREAIEEVKKVDGLNGVELEDPDPDLG